MHIAKYVKQNPVSKFTYREDHKPTKTKWNPQIIKCGNGNLLGFSLKASSILLNNRKILEAVGNILKVLSHLYRNWKNNDFYIVVTWVGTP